VSKKTPIDKSKLKAACQSGSRREEDLKSSKCNQCSINTEAKARLTTTIRGSPKRQFKVSEESKDEIGTSL
jgi:hypothetical protein